MVDEVAAADEREAERGAEEAHDCVDEEELVQAGDGRAKLEWRSFWMSGRAPFTIVMSSKSMNVAVQAASNVHHFRSILLAFPVTAVLYQRPQCTIVSSGLRRPGLKSVPIVYATGINAICMISS